jgi:hypothetical protein
MPQTFAVHPVVDVIAALVGVSVGFWIACAYVRRRLDRGRTTSASGNSTTLSTRSHPAESDTDPRRPFRMPARVVASAPVPLAAGDPQPDLSTPPGPLAPAHLYDLVSRDYLPPTTSMPAVVPSAAPVAMPPLPRREPRARSNWVRSDWDRPESNSTRSDSAKQYRTGPGWFGEGEACG